MFAKYKGEVFLASAGILFALNGIVSSLALEQISTYRLTAIRCLGAFLIILAIVGRKNFSTLKVPRRDVPKMIAYGFFGFACVQLGYFIGIQRGLPISLVLLLEFTAPIWIVLWLKFVRKVAVPNIMWAAIICSLAGLALVSRIWRGFNLDAIGVAGALGAGVLLAVFFLQTESIGNKLTPQALTAWGFGGSTIVWTIVAPWWSFPYSFLTAPINLKGPLEGSTLPGWLFVAWIIVMGTVAPYLFVMYGIKRVGASTGSIMGMLEPIFVGIFAWIWLSQSWVAIQLFGALVVLIGIYLAERAKSARVAS